MPLPFDIPHNSTSILSIIHNRAGNSQQLSSRSARRRPPYLPHVYRLLSLPNKSHDGSAPPSMPSIFNFFSSRTGNSQEKEESVSKKVRHCHLQEGCGFSAKLVLTLHDRKMLNHHQFPLRTHCAKNLHTPYLRTH